MPEIIQMPVQLANLIAAGEVVERPGSVVKELVENALDAGARHITVEIKNGGVSYLRVTDDGKGIQPEDVRTAFLPHATSKLHNALELHSIGTLGFRGEALSSIAAVARVDIFTRTRRYTAGVHLNIEGGEEMEYGETGCPVGTTVVVRDLFFNVPARAKFLKKDATEGAYAEMAVINAAIAAPEVAFHFIKDGRESFRTAGDGKVLSALRAHCGADVAARLCPIAGTSGETCVEGYLSLPDLTRGSRSLQSFFVNGRPVRSRVLTAAVEEAYKGRLMHGRYPICFLHIQVPLGAVDVNVHPAKLEVKFAYEKEVFSTVYSAVRTALETADRYPAVRPAQPKEDHVTREQRRIQERPVYTVNETHSAGLAIVEEHEQHAVYRTKTGRPLFEDKPKPTVLPGAIGRPLAGFAPNHTLGSSPCDCPPPPVLDPSKLPTKTPPGPPPIEPFNKRAQPAAEQPAPEEPAPEGKLPAVRVVGEVFRTYLIAEDDEGLYLIDKHAARERQIYNTLLGDDAGQSGQLLLEPVAVRMSIAEKQACLDARDVLAGAGFEVEDFGGGTLLVRQAPMYLPAGQIPEVISELAARLIDRKTPTGEALDGLRKSVACKAAIKAGTSSDPAELQRFAEAVLADPDIRSCPHGRPAVVRVERSQLEKLFKRIV